ncbi:ArsR/SmtB family transcription factor [Pelagibacterium lacus]|uniref:ArsR family transcriptional regulator n=1 Tax=Pelagibacterium lacus TaxID=2282655 RepID=A0A369W3A0_9HYPH|nr:helix-turn-helix domain-containing protein [Pelagibacterium lacus]RDE08823.1 ArsR family transcriptional regulator [Pelagibacterium lacus]
MREISKIVPGPQALKALTHPDRLKMLGILRLEGPQTATGLAARLGLNSGATSYHLRQLAHHGFIETDAERGNRRERWWKARHESTLIEPAEAEGEAYDASMAMMQAVISHHAAAMQRAHEHFSALPLDWRKAQTFSDFTIPLSPQAAKELMDRLHAILWAAKEEAPEPGAPLPEGWRPFTVHLHGFPHVPPGKGEA